MPVKINTYACDFRCGYTNTKKLSTVKHESNCLGNPEKSACKTCKFLDSDTGDNGMDGGYSREYKYNFCSIDKGCEPTPTNKDGLIVGCKYWEGSK